MATAAIIGIDQATQEPVSIDAKARQHSVYMIGMRQYGKSNLLEHIAWSDMAGGDGLCFIDPLGKSADRLMQFIPEERKNDVIFWDVADREHTHTFNPFFCTDREEIDRKADEFLDLLHNLEEFRKAFEGGNRMNEVIYNLAVTFLVNHGSTLAQARRFLRDKNFRSQFYQNLLPDYSEIHQFWLDVDGRSLGAPSESYDAVLNKLSRFVRSRTMKAIFGQAGNSIDFRSAMDEGKIIIVSLTDKIGREDAAFVGAYVIWDIARSMYQRTNKRPFHILVDEFSRYMTTTFERLHEEGGNFGLDVIIAHQHRDQIDDVKIKGGTLAVGNLIAFRVSGKDAGELSHGVDIRNRATMTGTRQSVLAPVFDPIQFIMSNGTNNENILRCITQVIRTVLDKKFEFEMEIKQDLIRIFNHNQMVAKKKEILNWAYKVKKGGDPYYRAPSRFTADEIFKTDNEPVSEPNWLDLFYEIPDLIAPISLIPSETLRSEELSEILRSYLLERMHGRPAHEIAGKLAGYFEKYTYVTFDRISEDIASTKILLANREPVLAEITEKYHAKRAYYSKKYFGEGYIKYPGSDFPFFEGDFYRITSLKDEYLALRERLKIELVLEQPPALPDWGLDDYTKNRDIIETEIAYAEQKAKDRAQVEAQIERLYAQDEEYMKQLEQSRIDEYHTHWKSQENRFLRWRLRIVSFFKPREGSYGYLEYLHESRWRENLRQEISAEQMRLRSRPELEDLWNLSIALRPTLDADDIDRLKQRHQNNEHRLLELSALMRQHDEHREKIEAHRRETERCRLRLKAVIKELYPLMVEYSRITRELSECEQEYITVSAEYTSLKELIPKLERLQAIMSPLIQLGDELEKDPIQTSSGHYEMVNGNPSGIWAEVANEIVQSPMYFAHCVIVQDGTPKHAVIKTLEPPDFTFSDEEKAAARARGEELKRLSQKLYNQRGNDDAEPGISDVSPEPDNPPPESPRRPASRYDDPPISTDE